MSDAKRRALTARAGTYQCLCVLSSVKVRLCARRYSDRASCMAINTVRQGLYVPKQMAQDLAREAKRLQRSKSWLMQRAWRIARERIAEFPPVEDDEELQ